MSIRSLARSHGLHSAVGRIVVLAILVLIWLLAAKAAPLFVPTPAAVATVFHTWAGDGTITSNLYATLEEVAYGGVLAFVVGIPVGIVLAGSRILDDSTRPFLDIMNAIPRLGLAPLFVLWLGLGLISKVTLVFSVLVFIVIINVYQGVKGVEQEHRVMVRLLGASRWDMITKVTIPTLVPWLVASLRLGSAYAVSGAVIAEFVAGDKGLGYLLAYESSLLNAAGTFAALFLLAAVSLVITLITIVVEKYSLRWRRVTEGDRR